MTQEKLPHRKELCLQSEAVSSETAFFADNNIGKNFSCKMDLNPL